MSTVIAPSISQRVRDFFNFEVVKLPLSGPEGMPTGVYGLWRDDQREMLGSGSVTSRYIPHTTDDVCVLAERAEAIFDGNAQVDCHFADGHYLTVCPSDAHRVSIFGTSDNIFPRLLIRAGLDGESFKVIMGFYRDACDNLSMLRTVDAVTVSIRHTKQLRGKIEDLKRQFSLLERGWENTIASIRGMQNRQVQLRDFLLEVYPIPTGANATDEKLAKHLEQLTLMMSRVADERLATGRPNFDANYTVSAWEAYNAVQGYVQHEKTRRNLTSDFQRILKASADKDVKRAEQLALAV